MKEIEIKLEIKCDKQKICEKGYVNTENLNANIDTLEAVEKVSYKLVEDLIKYLREKNMGDTDGDK